MSSLAALLLAGGESKRMGSPKAFLMFNDKTFLDHQIDSYREFGIKKIILVVNHKHQKLLSSNIYDKKNIKVVFNKYPELGRGFSLQLGLNSLKNYKGVFISNCDNPIVPINLLSDLKKKLKPSSYVVPVFRKKGGHPVLLSNTITEEFVQNNWLMKIPLNELLSGYKKYTVDANKDVLLNINDWESYCDFLNEYQNCAYVDNYLSEIS